MNCEEVEELIGAYVLRALPVESIAEIGAHLATCTNHPDAAELELVASGIGMAAPEIEPPRRLKDRLMDAVRREAGAPVSERRGIAAWVRGLQPQRALPYALAGALAVAVLALVLTNLPSGDGDEAQVLNIGGAGNINGTLYLSDDGESAIALRGLDPLAEGQTYQVWGIRGSQPTSIGLLGTADEGEAAGTLEGDISQFEVVALTVEPAGGSDLPTTDPLFQVRIAT